MLQTACDRRHCGHHYQLIPKDFKRLSKKPSPLGKPHHLTGVTDAKEMARGRKVAREDRARLEEQRERAVFRELVASRDHREAEDATLASATSGLMSLYDLSRGESRLEAARAAQPQSLYLKSGLLPPALIPLPMPPLTLSRERRRKRSKPMVNQDHRLTRLGSAMTTAFGPLVSVMIR